MQEQRLEWLKSDINELKCDIKDLDSKVDELLQFRWKVVGGTVVASLVLTSIFQVGLALIK